ncbi:PAS domain-containing protein [Plastoroseomonas arctica]|uniref:histidine kinase n=1 Tax=Plastoroseomonas arctica TaxID=1509237 RepID=A0AAF1K5Q2_9PROT|nr:PAS domain-containing protein [Plastoroseomonas arctica]MBR0656825.1 PAS domain-containing protein [Plastoroseomonas arctica]
MFSLTRDADGAFGVHRRLSRLARALPIVAILVPLAMVAGAAWLNWQSAWSEAATAMRRSAEAGAEYGARALESYGVAVGRLNDRLAGLSDAEIRAEEHGLHLELQRVLRDIPHAEAALVLDRDGFELVSSDRFPVRREAAHRERGYVNALRGVAPPGVHITEAMLPEAGGALVFSVARQRHAGGDPATPEGGFDGVTLVTIRSNDVGEGLRRLLVSPNDAMALVQDSGAALAMSTPQAGPLAPAPINGPYRAAVAGRGPPVFETIPDTWVEGSALAAVRPVEHLRIHALALRPRAQIVEAWRASLVGHVAFALPAALMLLLLSLQVRRDQLRLASANQGLEGDVARGADRLRRAEEIGMIGTFEFDPRSGANIRSAEYMSVHGMPALETQERHEDWVRRLHPDDRDAAEAHILGALADPQKQDYAQTYRIVTPAGEVRWIMARGRIERDEAGLATLLRGAHLDVTQLRNTELALADSDARLRLAQEAVGIGTWEWVPATRQLRCSRKMLELWGFGQASPAPGMEDILDGVIAEDRPALRSLMEDTRQGARLRAELRLCRRACDAPREIIWVAVRATLLAADPLAPARIIGVAYDITERKRSDELTTIMAHEVEHRAKNALMVVSSLLRMTKATSAENLVEVMDGRVRALSRTMGLLGQGRWRGAGLRDIVESEVGHFELAEAGQAASITLDGPPVTIGVDSAQPLSMALHELATNAAKYGALSVATGRLSIEWRVEGPTVHLLWTERGGPALAGTPPRRGFGSHLITMLIEGQLQGQVNKLWEGDGLVCTITFPLTAAG